MKDLVMVYLKTSFDNLSSLVKSFWKTGFDPSTAKTLVFGALMPFLLMVDSSDPNFRSVNLVSLLFNLKWMEIYMD